MRGIFEPVFKKICDLLVRQLQGAGTNRDKHGNDTNGPLIDRMVIDKVVLVGGFADSAALQNEVSEVIKKFNEQHKLSIQLIRIDSK